MDTDENYPLYMATVRDEPRTTKRILDKLDETPLEDLYCELYFSYNYLSFSDETQTRLNSAFKDIESKLISMHDDYFKTFSECI